MTRLPASFASWVFLPDWGVVKIHVSVDDGEISGVVLDTDDRRTLHAAPSEDERRRMDEAASDALAAMQRCLTSGMDLAKAENEVEARTIGKADEQETQWNTAPLAYLRAMMLNEKMNRTARERDGITATREPHPEDATPPAWME